MNSDCFLNDLRVEKVICNLIFEGGDMTLKTVLGTKVLIQSSNIFFTFRYNESLNILREFSK